MLPVLFFKRWLSLTFLLMLLALPVFLGACGNDKPPEEGGEHAGEEAAAEGHDSGGDESGGEEGGEEEVPVGGVMATFPFQEITLTTKDKLVLYGKLYDPLQVAEAAAEDEEESSSEEDENAPVLRYPLVILIHGVSGTNRDWGDLPAKLVGQGYAVFALDMRGHGRSIRFKGGRKLSWRDFSESDWANAPKDIGEVLKFFGKQDEDSEVTQVDASRVGLIGAGIGANVAIIAAGKNSDAVKALVVLSPTVNTKGLSTTVPMVRYRNGFFIAASQTTPVAFEDSDTLYRLALGPKAIRLYKNLGSGIDMLTYYQPLRDEIVQWMASKLPPTGIVETPKPSDEEAESEAEGDEAASDGSEEATSGHGSEKPASAAKAGH